MMLNRTGKNRTELAITSWSNITKLLAFTLAEVLLVIGIIGIIAAITIPVLVSNYQKQASRTKVKKTYATLAGAFATALNENGGSIISGFGNQRQLLELLQPYLSSNRQCTNVSTQKCFGSTYKYLSGTNANGSWNFTGYGIVLNDGSAVTVTNTTFSATCASSYLTTSGLCGQLAFDINSSSPPNQNGKDMFLIFVNKNKLIPTGAPGTYGMMMSHQCASYGYSCLANVLNNIDY